LGAEQHASGSARVPVGRLAPAPQLEVEVVDQPSRAA
jgi:hypothetical protein